MKKIFIFFLLFSFAFSSELIFIKKENGNYYLKKVSVSEKRKKEKKLFVAGKYGKVFHREGCSFTKRIKEKIYFKSRRKAIKAGYRPCKKCKP